MAACPTWVFLSGWSCWVYLVPFILLLLFLLFSYFSVLSSQLFRIGGIENAFSLLIGLGCRLCLVGWQLILAGYLCSGGAVGWVCPGLVCFYSPRIFHAFLFNSPIRGVLNVFSSFFSLQQFLYPWYWCGCSSRPCFP